MPVIKNKKVGTHAIDMLLSCGCIHVEPIEAAIDIPSIGDKRTCEKHGVREIKRVGSIYWLDKKEDQ